LPALSKAKINGRRLVHELFPQLCWVGFNITVINNDTLANNYGTPFVVLRSKQDLQQLGEPLLGLGSQRGSGASITNTDGMTRHLFYKYTGSLAIYKCPADHFVSTQQRLQGLRSARAHTPMNMFFGVNNPGAAPARQRTFPTYSQFLKSGSNSQSVGLFVMAG